MRSPQGRRWSGEAPPSSCRRLDTVCSQPQTTRPPRGTDPPRNLTCSGLSSLLTPPRNAIQEHGPFRPAVPRNSTRSLSGPLEIRGLKKGSLEQTREIPEGWKISTRVELF